MDEVDKRRTWTDITRRQMLIGSSSVIATGAFGLFSPAFAQAREFKEAPMLAELVSAGKLPPIHERLPENPLVVPVVERIGDFGGRWRTVLLGGDDGAWQVRTMGYENLLRWTPEWDGWIPNVAESYEVSPDSKSFTFKLRAGMKWSDGVPFTSDDIMFWYEDVFLNAELTPSKASWLTSGGKPVVVEKDGPYSVRFSFAEPNGMFLRSLADVRGLKPNSHPRHFLERFHPKYSSNVDQLVREAGVVDWVALFELKGGGSSEDIRWWYSDVPSLNGWVMTLGMGDSTSQMVAERNPYYWKVDTEGNQLPYIDGITYDFVEDVQVLLLKALSGEIDLQDRHLATSPNKAVLFDGMEQGDYRFYETKSSAPNTSIIQLNLTHKDPIKRRLYNNKDFRIGLSYALNRQEIIDVVYVGQGEPAQNAPGRDSVYFNEQLLKQYTDYNVDLANQHLDKAGLTNRDAEGFRLGEDGNRVSFAIDMYNSFQEIVDSMELAQKYWQAVGIEATLNPADRSLISAKVDVGDFDVHVYRRSDGGIGDTVITAPQAYFPVNSLSAWALGWAAWNSQRSGSTGGPVEAVEPPASVQEQFRLYDQIMQEGDGERQIELMNQILQITADEFPVLGISTEAPGYGVVRNRLRNVPDVMFASFSWPCPVASNTVQYFFLDGRNT